MPLLSIETNQPLMDDDVLTQISASTAAILGKPESYVLIKYEHNENMLFGGNNAPLAHLKLKSLGLPEEQTSTLSKQLCGMMLSHFNIPAERVYIEFSNPPRHLWGWNSGTF